MGVSDDGTLYRLMSLWTALSAGGLGSWPVILLAGQAQFGPVCWLECLLAGQCFINFFLVHNDGWTAYWSESLLACHSKSVPGHCRASPQQG